MRKSDMISLNGSSELTFSNMGLFSSDLPWTHPTVTVDSTELIYVTEGEVRLKEGETRYVLHKGDGIFLSPQTEHGGYGEKTKEKVSFYWLHYFVRGDIPELPKTFSAEWAEKDFKELMHASQTDLLQAELRLALFFCGLSFHRTRKNPTVFEAEEYIRLSAHAPLKAAEVARRFGYSPDRLSVLFKKELGKNLQTVITEKRIAYIQNRLLNTGETIADVAAACGFADENLLEKYFRYHTGESPTSYRNRFFRIHRNQK
ncbi:MAG: AraC family transcriptional regulator [Clostridia bacterium]|nr:AraC family transcriptional regulator [Clostridia bacterium]